MASTPVIVGPEPITMTCPHCRARQTTLTEKEPSMLTHIMFCLLCIVGCWPCAPCVYCFDSCLVVNHRCARCGQFIGTYTN